MLTIKEIDYVLAIADHGSVLRAAEALYMSQSALSKYLISLEEKVGTQLFIRDRKKNLVLTESGEIYVRRARIIAKERDLMLHEIKKNNDTKTHLRIGVGLNVEVYHLSEIIHEFKSIHPECEVDISVQLSFRNMQDLDAGNLDFVATAYLPESSGYDAYPLFDEYLLLVMPKDSSLVSHIVANPETGLDWIDHRLVEGKRFIMQDESCWIRGVIDAFQAAENIKLNTSITTNSTKTAIILVEQGMGLCFCTNKLTFQNEHVRYATVGSPLVSECSSLIFRHGEKIPQSLRDLALVYRKYNGSAKYKDAIEWKRLINTGFASVSR